MLHIQNKLFAKIHYTGTVIIMYGTDPEDFEHLNIFSFT
jgi:hypothetical protein